MTINQAERLERIKERLYGAVIPDIASISSECNLDNDAIAAKRLEEIEGKLTEGYSLLSRLLAEVQTEDD